METDQERSTLSKIGCKKHLQRLGDQCPPASRRTTMKRPGEERAVQSCVGKTAEMCRGSL